MSNNKTAVVPKDATDYRTKVDLRQLELRTDHYLNTGAVRRTRRTVLRKFARRNPHNRTSRIREYLQYIAENPIHWDSS